MDHRCNTSVWTCHACKGLMAAPSHFWEQMAGSMPHSHHKWCWWIKSNLTIIQAWMEPLSAISFRREEKRLNKKGSYMNDTDNRHQIPSSCQIVYAFMLISSKISIYENDRHSWRSTSRSIKRKLLPSRCRRNEKAESTSIIIPNLHVPVLGSWPVVVARPWNPQATSSWSFFW